MITDNNLDHSFTITVGDPDRSCSSDGCDSLLYVCNKPWEEVVKLHGMASILYDLALNKQCKGYNDYYWTLDFYTRLCDIFSENKEVLTVLNYYIVYPKEWHSARLQVSWINFARIYLEIAKLVDCDLVWKEKTRYVPDIHIGGYGLF